MATFFVNGCEIAFKNHDDINLEARIKAKELVRLMSSNKKLLGILLDSTSHYRLEYWSETYKNFNEFIESKIVAFDKLKNELQEFQNIYGEIIDGRTISGKLPEKQNRIDFVDKIRGEILEVVLNEKACRINTLHRNGCKVSVNKTEIRNKALTVDFAGFNGSRCQFYECKVSPVSFTKDKGWEQVQLLLLIKEKLNDNKIQNEIYCVSANNYDPIISKMKKALPPNKFSMISFIGKKELIS